MLFIRIFLWSTHTHRGQNRARIALNTENYSTANAKVYALQACVYLLQGIVSLTVMHLSEITITKTIKK